MNTFWVILIILISLIILGILFFLFMVWGISQGLRNKYGPEWISGELNIRFNHFNINSENKKTIRYLLSENETYEITTQIEDSMNSHIENNYLTNSDKFSVLKYIWIKSNNETYEYRQIENDKLKAMLLLNSRELIYFK
ncbi:hypothetical protein [Rhodonellum sp.]|uniref:hypothetical protein n=1 Tax=Rhodonellum sp. TaxID=2231180 RepID=UPI0027288021|nr:hypothetical protein [Rhodonellum sp.]MDO9551922.1 hypothetical protein [Rhodonellum sp.]